MNEFISQEDKERREFYRNNPEITLEITKLGDLMLRAIKYSYSSGSSEVAVNLSWAATTHNKGRIYVDPKLYGDEYKLENEQSYLVDVEYHDEISLSRFASAVERYAREQGKLGDGLTVAAKCLQSKMIEAGEENWTGSSWPDHTRAEYLIIMQHEES